MSNGIISGRGFYLLLGVLVLAGRSLAVAQTAVLPSGTGTSADPYLISELGHLVWMGDTVASSPGKYYTMTADIDASSTATWNDTGTSTDTLEGFNPIGDATSAFGGIFDGAGHTIAGPVIVRPATDYVGLFGFLGTGGQVRNVQLVGGSSTGFSCVGSLVGANSQATVWSCCATGAVTGVGDKVGGLVGDSTFGTVWGCYATGAVAGTSSVGGLVGNKYYGTVSDCYATGAVTGTGGSIGGLAGSDYYGQLSACFACGRVAGAGSVGGLLGDCRPGAGLNSYWDMQASGQSHSPGGTGRTTSQMKQQATFAGFDFRRWAIAEGASYPYLRSSPSPFRLTIFTSGPGKVTIDPVAADATYAPGTVVTLTALPNDEDDVFIRWAGARPDHLLKSTVVMDTHRSVTASFRHGIVIASLGDLSRIGVDPAYPLNGMYSLKTDIDASATATWNDAATDEAILEGFGPIGTAAAPFTGVFAGNGHTIAGLVINRPTLSYVGLFGYVGASGQARDLNVSGGSIAALDRVGALAGFNAGAVSAVHVTGEVTGGGHIGGLVGDSSGQVWHCSSGGVVTGSGDYIGGLIGRNSGMVFTGCATGAVTGSGLVGGLLGYSSGTASSCYATGPVSGSSYMGGLVGMSYGTVLDCYATGTVRGAYHIGGLVGSNAGTVLHCFASGSVPGPSYFGGLVGYSNRGTVSDSYWDKQTCGRSTSEGGTGKGTSELKQQTTFAGWDFTSVWAIAEEASYPYLRSSPPPFRLNVTVPGPGLVTLSPPSADGTYAPGTVVTLQGQPHGVTGVLTPWLGAEPSEFQTAGVVMDTHRSVCATFRQGIAISCLADLLKIGNDPAYPLEDALYVLTSDIDASETATWNDAGTDETLLEGFNPIGSYQRPFTGCLDGNGYTITGLVINRRTADYIGLLGYVQPGGEVRNLGLVGGTITGNFVVGGLIGSNSSGIVSNCYFSGVVTGSDDYVGGLLGFNGGGRVSHCRIGGQVKGYSRVGGLIGANENWGVVSRCYAASAVTGKGSYIGGLVGINTQTTVSDCYASGPVTGPVYKTSYIGGLVGSNSSGTLVNCHATGLLINGSSGGGLVGWSSSGTVLDAYWDMQTSGLSTSYGGIGKTTAEMKHQATYAGWDFTSTWLIAENMTYPWLHGPYPDSDGDIIPDTSDNCPNLANASQTDTEGDEVGDACDLCPETPPGTPVSQFGCGFVAADLDLDGDVDAADAGAFEACAAGPGVAIAGDCGTPDFDTDGDVDSTDFAVLQRCFSGEAQAANPNCQ